MTTPNEWFSDEEIAALAFDNGYISTDELINLSSTLTHEQLKLIVNLAVDKVMGEPIGYQKVWFSPNGERRIRLDFLPTHEGWLEELKPTVMKLCSPKVASKGKP